MARRARRTKGFWRGLLTGLGLAATIALALALLFPATLFLPPALEPGQLLAPPAPGAPERAADPGRPQHAAALTERLEAPPVASPPAIEAALGIDPFAPPPEPEVFDGNGSALPVPPVPTSGPARPSDAGGPGGVSEAVPAAMPLLGGQPGGEEPAGMAAFTPPPTPTVFDGGPAGSPSLAVPVAE